MLSSNIPSILPTSMPRTPSFRASSHAQDLSTMKLNQYKDREAATTSIGRAISRDRSSGPMTSVSRAGQNSSEARTSINDDQTAKRSIYDDNYVDENRERLRYQHIRELIKQRKAEEEAGQTSNPKSVYDTSINTTPGFKRYGVTGYARQISKMRRLNPASYKNIDKKDQDYFLDVVESHAKATSTGKGYGRLARRNMKMKIEQDRQAGKISYADSKDMKRMVNQLPKSGKIFG